MHSWINTTWTILPKWFARKKRHIKRAKRRNEKVVNLAFDKKEPDVQASGSF